MPIAQHVDQLAQRYRRQPVAPGLPANRNSPLAKRRPDVGATVTKLPHPEFGGSLAGRIAVAGLPSVQLIEEPGGGASAVMTLNTQYAASMRDGDLSGLRRLLTQMVALAGAMSRGPLTLRMLAAMGHPYGRDKGGIGRRVPRGAFKKSVGHIPGQRGSVPTLSVVNIQSGEFAAAWSGAVQKTAGGVTLKLTNGSDYAWYLAHGTPKMQAHGPWTYVMTKYWPQLIAEWQRVVAITVGRMQASGLVGV